MKSERGQSLVEFAISFVFIVFLLSGAVEFGIVFFQSVQLKDAAQEGALYGSMFPYDTVSIEKYARGASNTPINLTSSDVQVFISFEQGRACEGDGVRVLVTYPHKLFMPFIPKLLGRDVIVLRGEVTDTVLNPECE